MCAQCLNKHVFKQEYKRFQIPLSSECEPSPTRITHQVIEIWESSREEG